MNRKLLISMAMAIAAVLSAAAANADLNGDGWVSRYDYDLLAAAVAEGRYVASYDLDGNGELDTVDCNRLLDDANYHDAYVGNKTYTVNGVSFKMVGIEGGTFTMGATAEQGGDYYSDEMPVHSVTLSDFMIGETEVTEELWKAVMGSNPSYFRSRNNLQCPVQLISWNTCQSFVSKLNEMTGEMFRLPTEAEWEYAARGGNKSEGYKYSGGNTLNDVAWNAGNAYKYNYSMSDTNVGPQSVATRLPNELGLYDMSGNVQEWCQDWYGSYSSIPQENPKGPSSGEKRVARGGSWVYDVSYCRVSCRRRYTPTYYDNHIGLRLAR